MVHLRFVSSLFKGFTSSGMLFHTRYGPTLSEKLFQIEVLTAIYTLRTVTPGNWRKAGEHGGNGNHTH